jgi:excisionase family DNA binding protein
MPASERLFYTVSETAKLLATSPYTIRNLVRHGKLSARRLSRTNWTITAASIEKFARVKDGIWPA